MQRVLAAAFSGVLLGGALVACSSSDSGSSPSATTSSSGEPIACSYYNEMESDINTITGEGGSGDTTVADARAALSEVQTAVDEVGKTGNAEDATVKELGDLTQTFQADLTSLEPNAPLDKASKATPSPSPAFDTLQNQIYTTYKKMGSELGC